MNAEFYKNNPDVYNALLDITIYKRLFLKNKSVQAYVQSISTIELQKQNEFMKTIKKANTLIKSLVFCKFSDIEELDSLVKAVAIQHAEILRLLLIFRHGKKYKWQYTLEQKKWFKSILSEYDSLCSLLSGKSAFNIIVENHSFAIGFILFGLSFVPITLGLKNNEENIWLLLLCIIFIFAIVIIGIIMFVLLYTRATQLSRVYKVKNKLLYITSNKHQEAYRFFTDVFKKKI